ncbi:MFS transporter, FHS family, L-fucose permease [Granulicella rosea]|uniref:MFS transporter, FHS family, L-fucose permease n=1 Tax=Granulicella rosea TaxID=474952 RepID=A0A239EQ88_9BACT|nr:L-fucose:H+ symporter permease [Granulicella rosea]SNS46920.1 MFS transporter, FHS family, L-fucose permease [Granulicella rosea]
MNLTTRGTSNREFSSEAPLFREGFAVVFVLVIALFFLWGMSNNLTDILVQQFKKSFELSPFQAQLVQTAVFLGYFTMSLPMAIAMRRWGYKVGMLCGLAVFGVGTLMFWPAAVLDTYGLMLTALFLIGCGSAMLETAANPFIAEAGPAETSERRLNFAQAFNPAGAIAGILVGTWFIFSGVELAPDRVTEMKAQGTYAAYLHGELMRVVPPYVALGIVVLLLGAVLATKRLPSGGTITVANVEIDDETVLSQLAALLKMGSVRAAVLAQFCYCGAQVGTWSAFIPYMKQYTHVTERGAGLLLTGNLIALTCGRFLSTALMRWIAPTAMMAVYAVVNLGLILIAVWRPGTSGVAALVATSFFMSIMFPTIFALGLKGLGKRTKIGGSLIVMSVVGGAIVPPLLGLVARLEGSYAMGYIVVASCYVVVAAYALRVRRRAKLAKVAVQAVL